MPLSTKYGECMAALALHSGTVRDCSRVDGGWARLFQNLLWQYSSCTYISCTISLRFCAWVPVFKLGPSSPYFQMAICSREDGLYQFPSGMIPGWVTVSISFSRSCTNYTCCKCSSSSSTPAQKRFISLLCVVEIWLVYYHTFSLLYGLCDKLYALTCFQDLPLEN